MFFENNDKLKCILYNEIKYLKGENMNKILSTLQDPKNWLELFLDNKKEYSENHVEALEFISKQNLSNITFREYEGAFSFVFEYENWNDLPKNFRKIIHVENKENESFDDEIFVDFFGIRAFLNIYDISEKSGYIYEDFMHSLRQLDKRYICIDISI